MRQHQQILTIATRGRALYDFTREVRAVLGESGLRQGVITLWVQHTSASLLVQENADPSVQRDLERFFSLLVRDGDPSFEHRDEGPDDMPAHVRAALTQTQLSVPFAEGQLLLGTWQGIYLYEHRHAAHARRVVWHALGEA